MRRTDDGNGPMVFLLDNHFAALLDLRQHRAYIAGKFGFCDADGHAVFDHSGYSCPPAEIEQGKIGVP